jgi:hypothetical protein
MIRGSTVVYIILLFLLVGAYLYLNNRERPADIELTAEPGTEIAQEYLFTAEEGLPTSIRIESKTGETVEVARGAENAWEVIQPVEAQADQAAAEAAATQVTTMRILETVPDVDPSIIGLEDPEYILTIKFTGGGERKADIGVITPTESGYYLRDENTIVIVSRSAVDSVLGLLSNPPYAATLTPVPVTPEASESATPQP